MRPPSTAERHAVVIPLGRLAVGYAPRMSGVNDVEKRWRDPVALRSAVAYVVVVVVAAIVFASYAIVDTTSIWWSAATPAVTFLGALGAFVKCYRDWRAARAWPIWQGAGWFLLVVTLLVFGLPLVAVSGLP